MYNQGFNANQRGLAVPQQSKTVRKKSSSQQLDDARAMMESPMFQSVRELSQYDDEYKELRQDYTRLQPGGFNAFMDSCLPMGQAPDRDQLRGRINDFHGKIERKSDALKRAAQGHATMAAEASTTTRSADSGWTGMTTPSFHTVDSTHYHTHPSQSTSVYSPPTLPRYTIGQPLPPGFNPTSSFEASLVVRETVSPVQIYQDSVGVMACQTTRGWYSVVYVGSG